MLQRQSRMSFRVVNNYTLLITVYCLAIPRCHRPSLCPFSALSSLGGCGGILDELLGVQISIDVCVRDESRDWRGEWSRFLSSCSSS